MNKTGNIVILRIYVTFVMMALFCVANAQFGQRTQWSADGNAIIKVAQGEVIRETVANPEQRDTLASKTDLTPSGREPLSIRRFALSDDGHKILINTNTKRVWRYDTRGDYWVFDQRDKSLRKLGGSLPESSLMYAKLSPDGSKAAYVSAHNLYVEDLASGKITPLTQDGSDRIIHGTFDWAYEEEFGCRDGFRWSPDGQKIAYWTIDARTIRNFLMINNTDSAYAYTIPVEYPKVGEAPSGAFVSVVDIDEGHAVKMDIPGDPVQHYLPRMEWAANSDELIIQQLNRKQQESNIYIAHAMDGTCTMIYHEKDDAWIDIKARWNHDDPSEWEWIDNGKAFIWMSEKDGWRHLYRIDRKGNEKLISPGDFDVIGIDLIDEINGYIYFSASPENATQKYLYRIKLTGGKAEKITPDGQNGSHSYTLSPNGTVALHQFSSHTGMSRGHVISLPNHKTLLSGQVMQVPDDAPKVEFFKVTTADSVEMDGWMVKPTNFDPAKKYPVVFYVYGEPAGQTVTDTYGAGGNRLYKGSMADDGYLYISVENRGTPAPKGREWRKSIYRNIGILNIRDQAMAAKEIVKWPFVDSSRIAVWGWSGGGSSTLNLLFQYPEIYQTGIAVAAVADQLMYDNIYQERYMGIPQEAREDFVNGSPVTHAKNLQGNLLYIHGTADDNVHYQNAELLINELIKHNKQFSMMPYPNRSHGISEGEGTGEHLSTLYTNFLKQHCPPGGK
ncbi:S9 family peptidase [Parapedobacter tibetensis]|uniref:S9 family peptidase n=1 Tax=Parapedobacter tibetensis TaxID=2972951 RepID=UPI00214D781B|nr:S9 family peptidase [Parapedobacter tibetensis]